MAIIYRLEALWSSSKCRQSDLFTIFQLRLFITLITLCIALDCLHEMILTFSNDKSLYVHSQNILSLTLQFLHILTVISTLLQGKDSHIGQIIILED